MANKHQAVVYINNQTGDEISDIHVAHRFGDEDTEKLYWPSCGIGEETDDIRVVNYETGFGAMTSFDWWIVTWKQEGDDGHGNQVIRVYSSSASLINGFSEMIRQNGASIGNAINQNLSKFTGDISEKLKAGVGLLTDFISFLWTSSIGSQVNKTEYKEFMLKGEDDEAGVTITLKPDGIEFFAASGKASTKCHTMTIDEASLLLV